MSEKHSRLLVSRLILSTPSHCVILFGRECCMPKFTVYSQKNVIKTFLVRFMITGKELELTISFTSFITVVCYDSWNFGVLNTFLLNSFHINTGVEISISLGARK